MGRRRNINNYSLALFWKEGNDEQLCQVWAAFQLPFLDINGPFAQLLPGLETGHPVTVGQSPAHESHPEQPETATRKAPPARRKH